MLRQQANEAQSAQFGTAWFMPVQRAVLTGCLPRRCDSAPSVHESAAASDVLSIRGRLSTLRYEPNIVCLPSISVRKRRREPVRPGEGHERHPDCTAEPCLPSDWQARNHRNSPEHPCPCARSFERSSRARPTLGCHRGCRRTPPSSPAHHRRSRHEPPSQGGYDARAGHPLGSWHHP